MAFKTLRDLMHDFFSSPNFETTRDGGSLSGTLNDLMFKFFKKPLARLIGTAYLDKAEIGDQTNYLDISDTGIVTLKGSAKRILTLRAAIDYVPIIALTKPTQLTIGIFKGFSMPIWDSGSNSDEQLFFQENVPGRWEGISNIVFHVLVALGTANDVGKKFQFQFSWNNVGNPNVAPVTSHDVTDEKIVTSGSQYATYLFSFILDYDIDEINVESHNLLSGRLRRVAASSDEITGEVIVLDWHTHYIVNKMFKAP